MAPGFYVVSVTHPMSGSRVKLESRCFQPPSTGAGADPRARMKQHAKDWADFLAKEAPGKVFQVVEVFASDAFDDEQEPEAVAPRAAMRP
jgi:hypothetical protein